MNDDISDHISDPITDLVPEVGARKRKGGRADVSMRSRLPEQRPFRQSRLRYAPTEVVSADELEMIHDASLTVLEDIGMDVLNEEAQAILIAAGGKLDGNRIRIGREAVLSAIASAPAEFTLHATNPAHSLRIGGDWVAYGSVASAPNVHDRDNGRRIGNRADYQNLIKLGQMLNTVHFFAGYPVEPVDLHASIRHLDATFDA